MPLCGSDTELPDVQAPTRGSLQAVPTHRFPLRPGAPALGGQLGTPVWILLWFLAGFFPDALCNIWSL